MFFGGFDLLNLAIILHLGIRLQSLVILLVFYLHFYQIFKLNFQCEVAKSGKKKCYQYVSNTQNLNYHEKNP